MKTLSAFFMPLLIVAWALAGPLRFLAPPVVQRFPDGSCAWTAAVSCADPLRLQSAQVHFSLDYTLDSTEGELPPSVLFPAGCEDGSLALRRSFFPGASALLTAALVQDTVVTELRTVLTGESGSLLGLNRFCARPKNGEPEWIELKNVSSVTVSLKKVRVEGRALSGSLLPGETLTVHAAADSAEMRLWRPGVWRMALSSWPGLRNSGDTVRLTKEVGGLDTLGKSFVASVVLDSLIYGAGISPREACASTAGEDAAASAHGFALETPPGRWRRAAGPLTLTVTAPAMGSSVSDASSPDFSPGSSTYDLRVYDLDGLELCILARAAQGNRTFNLSTSTCPGLPASATSILILLQPQHAPPMRRLLRILP